MIPRVIVLIGALFLGVLALIIWMRYSEKTSSAAKKTTQVQTTTEQAKTRRAQSLESAQSQNPALADAGTGAVGDDSGNEPGSADEETGTADGDRDEGNDGPLAMPPPPSITLLSTAAAVPPDKHLSFEFNISRGYSSSSRVRGNVSAQGGEGDGISVSITDAAGLTNLARGQQPRNWYRSVISKEDQIDLRLPPGHYFVVLDNRGSLVPNKVKLDLRLVQE